MRIRFTKLSSDRHRFEVLREDAHESIDCETRSYLLHDLTHFALETAGGLSTGFFGLLAQGRTLSEVADMHPEALEIEQAVGALHGLAKGKSDARQVLSGLENLRGAQGLPMPAWLTEQVIKQAAEHLRRLTGHWASLKPGEYLELTWNPQTPPLFTR